jgi:hypothetical protein
MSRETNTFAALKGPGRFSMRMYYVSRYDQDFMRVW